MGFISGIYFSNWSVYGRKHFAKDLPIQHLTHVFYAFIGIDEATGKVKFTDEWADAQLPMDAVTGGKVTGTLQQLYTIKKLNRNLKVVMSIGGWGTAYLFSSVVLDPAKLANFVASSVQMVMEYGFDGIDIDWEYPKDQNEGRQLAMLLQKLRLALSAVDNSLLLTIASPGGDEPLSQLDLRELDRYLSFWNVMCYDFAGNSWSSKTGFHSNLFGHNGDNGLNCADILKKYMDRGVPLSKLVLGMPLYGRKFSQPQAPGVGMPFNKGGGSEDTVDYKLLHNREEFDPRKVGASQYDPQTSSWISYDSVQSAKIKAQYVKSNNFAGGMWWDSAGDSADPSQSLVVNFVNQIGGPAALDSSTNRTDYHNSKYLGSLVN